MIIPKPGVHAKVTEDEVKKYLSQRKKVSPDDKGVFGSFNLQDEFDKVQGLFIGIKVFSWVVADRHDLRGRGRRRQHHADRREGTHARDRLAQGARRHAGLHRRR